MYIATSAEVTEGAVSLFNFSLILRTSAWSFCVNLLFVNGLWQQSPDCIPPLLMEEAPSEPAVPWTQARFLPSVLYASSFFLLSVPGLCLLSCTSTAISSVVLVRKATCIKNNSVNKKPICNLDQLSDLIYSTNPKAVAEKHECEEAAGGKAGMGDTHSQAIFAAEVPLLYNCSCQGTFALAQISKGIPLHCLK